MKVKICGITTPDDARMAAEAGADAVGLNFVGGPRKIDLAQAERILDALPPLIIPVALVRLGDSNPGEMNEQVMELLATRWVSTVQVYGELTAPVIDRLAWEGFRVIVPLPVRDAGFFRTVPWTTAGQGRGPAMALLDAHDPNKAGGTGRTFAWSWVREARSRGELAQWPPVLLAGGLTPENVRQAVAEADPYGVDVSSGVESSPGRKDAAKVARFIAEARSAERHVSSDV